MQASSYLVLVALGVPLAVYVWAAMGTPSSKVSTIAKYFVSFRLVGAAPFADSSLAYAFQVGTLFPFLYWGVQGQILPAIVNALSWGLGIAAFRWFIRPILGRLGENDPKTLHGLLGEAFSSRAVQLVAAWVTILGMLGIALAEAYWGMQVVRVLVNEDTPAFYAIVFSALLFVLTYIWYGGTWGSMKTDMLQLVFSYIGFSFVFIYVTMLIVRSNGVLQLGAIFVAAIMVVTGTLSLLVRWRTKIKPISGMAPSDTDAESIDEHDRRWLALSKTLSIVTLVALGIMVACFVVVVVTQCIKGGIQLSPLLNPGDPGWVGVVALFIMGATFQFVDMSAWQRLQAIGGTPGEILDRARRGLLVYAIESPFTWVLCLALGTLLIATMPQLASVTDKAGPLAAYPRLLIESGGLVPAIIATLFMMAVMGVMFSTIDSALVAAMYAYVADVRLYNFSEKDLPDNLDEQARIKERAHLFAGKKGAFVFIALVCAGVVLLGAVLKKPDQLIGIMVGFYGGMLSLLPAVVGMLFFSRRWAGGVVAAGIICGVLTALGFTIWGVFEPDKAWYGVFAAPLIATIIPFVLSKLISGRLAN